MIRSRLLVVLGAVLVLCVVGLSGRANVAAPAPAIKWEYKSIVVNGIGDKTEKELNKAGADGWELAGVFSDIRHVGPPHAPTISTRGYLILKRPAQ
jgi:hypothetical protein